MGWDFARVVPEPAGGRAGPAGAPVRANIRLRALLKWAGNLLEFYLNLLEGVLGQQEPQQARPPT